MGNRLEKQVEVLNEAGIHARPAALLVKTANEYEADVLILKDGAEISAKSIMGLFSLEAYCGTVLTVVTDGADAEAAMTAMEGLFLSKFNEE